VHLHKEISLIYYEVGSALDYLIQYLSDIEMNEKWY